MLTITRTAKASTNQGISPTVVACRLGFESAVNAIHQGGHDIESNGEARSLRPFIWEKPQEQNEMFVVSKTHRERRESSTELWWRASVILIDVRTHENIIVRNTSGPAVPLEMIREQHILISPVPLEDNIPNSLTGSQSFNLAARKPRSFHIVQNHGG